MREGKEQDWVELEVVKETAADPVGLWSWDGPSELSCPRQSIRPLEAS